MNKLLTALSAIICLLFTACDKDEIVRPPMQWTWDILTPESVKYEGGAIGWAPSVYFRVNSLEGDIVMTCDNYSSLSFEKSSSDTYDCGWATVRIEGNKLKIHFPYMLSDVPEATEEFIIIGQEESKKAMSMIKLTREFESGDQPEPGTLPEAAKFDLVYSDFTTYMHLDSPVAAPLDLLTFKITDSEGNNKPFGFPDYTQYYDSIVWCADDLPDTFKVYERKTTAGNSEDHFNSQWSSHFFKSGTIKTHLKGYSGGEVIYETSLDVTLFERDFLCLQWGTIVLQNPEDITTYCLLDTSCEYKMCDIVAKDNAPYSQIYPQFFHSQLSDADLIQAQQKAIKKLMETNLGTGENVGGKAALFKCLPEQGTEAVLYWENKTTRIVMLHQLPDEFKQEKYYLHIEPK